MKEYVYREVFGILVYAIALTQLYFRCNRKTKSANAPREYGMLAAVAFWLASICIYPIGFAWLDYGLSIPAWIRWYGAIGMVASIPLSMWVYSSLGENFSPWLEIKNGHQLVRSGPYAVVRHPMYAALFLCAVAAALLSADVIVMTAGVVLIITMAMRARLEERMLIGHFGAEYRAYMSATGAFFPKLR